MITPKNFQEHILRLFVKDPAKFDIADKAFKKLARDMIGMEVVVGKTQSGSVRRATDQGLSQI
jgi:hypothetical protein